ncbi:hypothetical protein [Priestia megaterium]|uniref:hypothetical protein n=1 Tax=Priestia megaterium TaxID=1404 RepID=UPI002D7FDACC|nr:hypothetical protein [Priestia megaterium]MEB4858352.1 hypothetical protein [Priestia megaterium]
MNRTDILRVFEEKGINTSDVLKFIINDSLENFNELHRWSKKDYVDFQGLLNQLKSSHGNETIKTINKGKALENIVNFIIRKTYFFEVYENITTSTNEIDQVIRLSDKGKQALETYKISRKLLQIEEDIFLGECKNYNSNLSVTYVGKFYGLLKSCDCNFGIIFSVNGITGKEESWANSYGLLRVFRLIEKHESKNQNFFILDFNIEDFEKISKGISFFDLIKEKKAALKIATNHNQFLNQSLNENKGGVIAKVKELKI